MAVVGAKEPSLFAPHRSCASEDDGQAGFRNRADRGFVVANDNRVAIMADRDRAKRFLSSPVLAIFCLQRPGGTDLSVMNRPPYLSCPLTFVLAAVIASVLPSPLRAFIAVRIQFAWLVINHRCSLCKDVGCIICKVRSPVPLPSASAFKVT